MKTRIISMALMCCGTVWLTGCPAPVTTDACASRAAGDLVITEVMADPDGTDTGAEWIEVYNTLGTPIDLKGMVLYTKDTDGSNLKTHTIKAGGVASSSYFVFGDVRSGPNPAWVNYSYADGLGALGNARGVVGLRCGTTVIDEAKWSSPAKTGRSHMYGGTQRLDAAANDDETKWCDTPAGTVYFSPNAGTPGLANPVCVPEASQGTCLSGGVPRPIVPPKEGELVITEVMNNPSVSETTGEWFEVLAKANVDLNDVTVSNGTGSDDTLSSMTCLHVNAGDYVLLARSSDSALNGALPTPTAQYSVSFANGAERIILRRGDAGIDEATLSNSTSGRSWQLDPSLLDTVSNDTPANFCVSPNKWNPDGGGDYGSPGALNPACSGTATCTGHTVGDLVITEVMLDPDSTDTGNEWFEIYNPLATAADLTGVTLYTKDTTGTVLKTHSLTGGTVPSHGYYVFGDVRGATNPAWVNESYGATLGALSNTSGGLGLKCGTTTIDEMQWSVPSKSARSRMLNGGGVAPDAGVNDTESNWCDTPAGVVYFAPNAGTPGAANPACIPEAMAGTCLSGGVLRPTVPAGAGDLVITEVMNNPSISETSGEWFEVLAKKDVDLNDITIANGTGSNDTISSNDCVHVAAGDYVLFARSADPALNGGLPAPKATYSVSFTNGPERVILRRGDAGIDDATLATSTSGRSWQLDPTKLDATSNDTPTNFCVGPTRWNPDGGGDYGSPGAPNPSCSGTATCTGHTVGDLVITEVMLDPDSTDTGNEWLEVYNPSTVDSDLTGMTLYTKDLGGTVQNSFTIPNGSVPGHSYYVLGDVRGPTNPAWINASYGAGLGALSNTSGRLGLKCGTTVVDEMQWSVTPKSARSRMLNGGGIEPDAGVNDLEANWCDTPAGFVYFNPNAGTPGNANPACVPEAMNGTCLDNGVPRAIVPATLGDLFITEVLADPTISETTGEWFEVLARAEVDLNDITVANSSGSSSTITSQTCLRVHPGETVVLARSLDSFVNGNLPPPKAQYSVSLANGTNERLILRRGDAGIDEVAFFGSTAGMAWQFDFTKYDGGIGANDDPNAFCASQARWAPDGGGDYGSPGAKNPPCFGQCLLPDGGQRATVIAEPGDLVVTEWLPDPAGVNDPVGEYFELLVKRSIDLNGVLFGDTSSTTTTLTSPQCLEAAAGTYLVIAKNADSAFNGGLPKVDYTFAFDLNNSSDTIRVRAPDGGTIDDFSYTTSTYKVGAAWQLKPAFTGAADNDVPANLCVTPDAGANKLPDGDFGTPGRANVCP